jgi:hypothetical protein
LKKLPELELDEFWFEPEFEFELEFVDEDVEDEFELDDVF